MRDLLFATDCVELYLIASENIEKIKGQAFNIGGGIENSFSILELFRFFEDELKIKMRYSQLPSRESDQLVFVANTTKIKSLTNWKPKISKEKGIREIINWMEKN